MTGLGSVVYKERLRNPAVPGGKPKGYRVIYYAQLADRVKLLTIYSKPEQEDISNSEIELLVATAMRLVGLFSLTFIYLCICLRSNNDCVVALTSGDSRSLTTVSNA